MNRFNLGLKFLQLFFRLNKLRLYAQVLELVRVQGPLERSLAVCLFGLCRHVIALRAEASNLVL